MKPYTLVVIDMQDGFNPDNYAISKIKKHIIKAKIDNMPIMFVEYHDYQEEDDYGSTIYELVKLTSKYKKTYYVSKYDDNGSFEIKSAVEKYKLNKNLNICGINTDACVKRTVMGLSNNKYLKINVFSDACHSEYGHYGHNSAIEYMKTLKNVKVIM